ncbi:MAG: hypothetical protein RRY95_03690 [Oscillospiraceae bacterium]
MNMNLNKPIGGAKKYPTKATVNLAMRDGPKKNTRVTLLTAVLLLVCLCGFLKFGVLDMLLRAGSAEAAATAQEQLVTDMRVALADYDSVQEEYDNYRLEHSSMNGSLVSTMDGMALIEKYLLPASKVESFAVVGDVMTAKFSGVSLNQISDIYNALHSDEKIQGVEVYTAATTGERNDTTTATITIFLPVEDAPVTAADTAEGGTAQ